MRVLGSSQTPASPQHRSLLQKLSALALRGRGQARAGTLTESQWDALRVRFTDYEASIDTPSELLIESCLALEGLSSFLNATGSACRPVDLTPEHVKTWVVHLRSPSTEGRSFSSRQIRQRLLAIHRCYTFLANTGEVEKSPCLGLPLPESQDVVSRFEMKDLEGLFEAVAEDSLASLRDRAILSLFIDSGRGFDEIAGLDIADLDCQSRTVWFRNGHSASFEVLNRATINVVDSYVSRRRVSTKIGQPLWVRNQRRLTPNAILRIFVSRCRQAGLNPTLVRTLKDLFEPGSADPFLASVLRSTWSSWNDQKRASPTVLPDLPALYWR